MSLTTFEESLLVELRRQVATTEPTRSSSSRRWLPRAALGGLAGVGAVAIALNLGIASAPSAFAVDSAPDGDVVVTIHHLAGPSALEEALAAKGVRAQVTYRPDAAQPGGQARSASGGDDAACSIALAKVDGGLRFTLGAAQIAVQGASLQIVTSGSSPNDVGSPVEVAWSGGPCSS